MCEIMVKQIWSDATGGIINGHKPFEEQYHSA